MKSIMDYNAELTETVYNECCELPVKITRSGQSAVFQYDAIGNLLQKDTPKEITVLKYDGVSRKIAAVATYNRNEKSNPTLKESVTYSYNTKGLVERIGHSGGKKVRLIYDIEGRIQAMLDDSGRQMKIKYDQFDRPIEILEASLGVASISYAPSGEAKEEITSAQAAPKNGLLQMYQNVIAMLSASQIPLSY